MKILKVSNNNNIELICRILNHELQVFDGLHFLDVDSYTHNMKFVNEEEKNECNALLNILIEANIEEYENDISIISSTLTLYGIKVEEFALKSIEEERYIDLKIHKMLDNEEYCTIICCVDSKTETITWYDGYEYSENYEQATKRNFVSKEYQDIYNRFVEDIEEIDIISHSYGLQEGDETILDGDIKIERF